MRRRIGTCVLAVLMLAAVMVPAFAAGTGEYMWVNCANGKTLNLRSDPFKTARVLKKLECGLTIFNPGSVSLPKGGSARSFGYFDGNTLLHYCI